VRVSISVPTHVGAQTRVAVVFRVLGDIGEGMDDSGMHGGVDYYGG
jgi:hypothetical protein